MTLSLFIFALTSSLFSGVLALFAPCCITFLLPAYFASVFQVRRRIIPLTFVFFLGLATILMPVSLGVAWLASLFAQYHNLIFTLGGLLLITYGVMAFFGKTTMIPWHYRPDLDRPATPASVYVLGIFSGIASVCCAPVLAGMLTLTAISASVPLAFLISLAYILGMTIPLFILAFIWDKKQVGQSRFFKGWPIRLKIGRRQWSIHSTHLLTSIIFIAVGSFVLYVAAHGEAAVAPAWQSRISVPFQLTIRGWATAAARHPWISLAVYLLLFGGWLRLLLSASKNNNQSDD